VSSKAATRSRGDPCDSFICELPTSIALGFIGALLGPWVGRQLHLAEPLVLHVSGRPFPLVWSIVEAALFVAFLHLLSGRSWARS
jgi:uncharacterized membrane protein YeaQ/YmgE (transglycosylase-associated protein family)